jgi:hypothetical protein
MDHDVLVARIGELADRAGVRWVYFPRSIGLRGHRGFPDLVLAGPGGLALAECKTGTQLEPDQEAWRDVLRAAGAAWHLWHPADLWNGRILTELNRLGRP